MQFIWVVTDKVHNLFILNNGNNDFGKQWRPRWNATNYDMSLEPTLFAKVKTNFRDRNTLNFDLWTLKIQNGQLPSYCINQGTKIFQYCTFIAGRVTYNFHSSCKHMHLSFKSVCNKEHKGVICNMTSSSNSYRTRLWEELLVLSRFHS